MKNKRGHTHVHVQVGVTRAVGTSSQVAGHPVFISLCPTLLLTVTYKQDVHGSLTLHVSGNQNNKIIKTFTYGQCMTCIVTLHCMLVLSRIEF